MGQLTDADATQSSAKVDTTRPVPTQAATHAQMALDMCL